MALRAQSFRKKMPPGVPYFPRNTKITFYIAILSHCFLMDFNTIGLKFFRMNYNFSHWRFQFPAGRQVLFSKDFPIFHFPETGFHDFPMIRKYFRFQVASNFDQLTIFMLTIFCVIHIFRDFFSFQTIILQKVQSRYKCGNIFRRFFLRIFFWANRYSL